MTATAPDATRPLDEHLLEATTGALELFGIYLGDRLGLYQVLRSSGPVTSAELADAAGIAPRYAREWLEQQAVAGVLAVDGSGPDDRRFRLPEAHVGILADPTSVEHLAPFGRMLVGIARVLDEVAAAYRTGNGVPYARYGADFRSGQGDINRPAFSTALVDEWLPALGGGAVVERLAAGGRVADLGCGQGWSAIAVARAFPQAEVWGIDGDVASIEDARERAAAAGVTVRFEAVDAAELGGSGPFDAVLCLEMLHDLARPVEVLAAARQALAPGGAVLVADEAVAPRFTAPGDQVERMMYGWSIVHCLPASLAEQPSAAIGTVIREDVVRSLASEAGFPSVEVLPIDGGFFRLYELRTSQDVGPSGR
jgi:2-polyprenyl-3-methyl-5-hydroxy-6-metoxy-1,4-benzoquinol methylase